MSTPPFLDLPPGVRADRLTTKRGEFAVLAAGPAERPRGTALLVPGFTGSKEDFIAVLGGIAAAGHPVIAVDQRGQYETPGPDGEEAYGLEEFARDALSMVDAIGDGPVHLVGHSFGGLVARAATLADPAAVRSLTLLCSGPAAIPGTGADRARLMVDALGGWDLPELWEGMRAFNAAAGAVPPEDPAIVEFLRRRFVSNSPGSLRAIARRLLTEPDQVAELAALPVPVLVAYGQADDAWPPAVQADMAERLGADRVEIAGAAHSPAVDQPEATVAALTRFWAEAEHR
jgi:pimeloyl-ACP methyl ester carboxylesterase